MRWQNLLARFSGWFADAIVLGDYALASRFASIALRIRQAEHAPGNLHILLDELDRGELARRDARGIFPEPSPPLHELADDFEEMFAELGQWDDTGDACGETAAVYRAVPATRKKPQPKSLSSLRANAVREIPKAAQTSRSSRMSRRSSPRSYLLT